MSNISEILRESVAKSPVQPFQYEHNDSFQGYYGELKWAARYFFTKADSWFIQPSSYKEGYTEVEGHKIVACSEILDNRKWYLIDTGKALIKLIFQASDNYVEINVSSSNMDEVDRLIEFFRVKYPEAVRESNTHAVRFWHIASGTGECKTRELQMAPFDDVKDNYPPEVLHKLEDLYSRKREPRGGQIMLWQGIPGTGKTWALRTLISEWEDFAKFHYITDPDKFFASNGYMMNLLTSGPSTSNKWQVLILEDAGEMITVDSKRNMGQSLSRLLNLSDGLMGQGFKFLILFTTNEDIAALNAAVTRPGRCYDQIVFEKLDKEAATEWLEKKNYIGEAIDEKYYTIAELYSILDGTIAEDYKSSAKVLGFAA